MSALSARRRCPIDLLNPAAATDPYPLYRLIRETAPICWTTQGFWITSRHSDATALLGNPRCDHWGQSMNSSAATQPVAAALGRSLHLLSPGASTPFRRATLQAIIAQSTKSASDENARHADAILATIEGRERFDVVAEYAHPFTLGAVCRMMGLSETERAALDAILSALPDGILQALSVGPSGSEVAQEPSIRLGRFLMSLIADRRLMPRADLISLLVEAESMTGDTDAGDRQLVSLLILLFHAGHQNMMNFIGNALLALARHHDSLMAARNAPALLTTGIDELLRYDSPVQYIPLVAREAIQLDDQLVEPGEAIWIGIGAANRDPEVFASPDTLDLGRNAQRQLAFGHGAWRCIGARLAQIQGVVALQRFLAQVVDFRVADRPLRWRTVPVVQRGLHALPLEGVRYA